MGNFKRTKYGDRELTARALKLNARTRTLLLLLESDDLKQMNISALEKIASPENYQTLLDLDLIFVDGVVPVQESPVDLQQSASTIEPQPSAVPVQVPSVQTNHHESTAVSTSTAEIETNTPAVTVPPAPQVEQQIQVEALDFVEIKTLMQHTLKQYCGLMAKGLIIAIEQSNSIEEVRQYQGKWLTSLFETRISRQQLNVLLNTINHNMDRIEVMSA